MVHIGQTEEQDFCESKTMYLPVGKSWNGLELRGTDDDFIYGNTTEPEKLYGKLIHNDGASLDFITSEKNDHRT